MQYQFHTDPELLALLNQGDAKAFETIYKRYVKALIRYARQNIQTTEDCEEIIQDVFISLWERHQSLRILSLSHYLFTAVRYKVIRYIRHHKVKIKYMEHYRLFEAIYESIEPDERTPEAIHAALIHAITDLPARCQTAIKLRLLENLSNPDIAERMNISKKTVEVYMLKAFNHFRSAYHKI